MKRFGITIEKRLLYLIWFKGMQMSHRFRLPDWSFYPDFM